ncbi:MAG: hypothetical protein ACRENO_01640, partial [Thermodesulfobacteriota bacterium]
MIGRAKICNLYLNNISYKPIWELNVGAIVHTKKLLIISVLIVVAIGLLAFNEEATAVLNDSIMVSETKSKIDSGLLEKINEKITNIETRTLQGLPISDTDAFHNVIILVNKYPDKINSGSLTTNPAIQQYDDKVLDMTTELFEDTTALTSGHFSFTPNKNPDKPMNLIAKQNKDKLENLLSTVHNA